MNELPGVKWSAHLTDQHKGQSRNFQECTCHANEIFQGQNPELKFHSTFITCTRLLHPHILKGRRGYKAEHHSLPQLMNLSGHVGGQRSLD